MAYGRPVALPVGSPDLPEDPPHLGRLAAELRRYRLRYGAPAPSPAQRLDDRVRSHRARLRFIDEQMVELAAERRRLAQEIAGYEKGLALVLRTEIERLRERHGEAWSPVAIRAYRVWQLDGGRMRGARTVWPDPWLVAECARGGGRAEVPHSDGRCGPPGCGIYAAKHPELLLKGFAMAWDGAMGLVELTGKVVEHTHGYRGQRAGVVALGLVGGGRWLTTDDPAVIAAAFHDPAQTLVRWGQHDRSPRAPWARITEYLIEREASTWTSESSSG